MFHSITLEVSLKPFKETNEQFIRETCKGIFRQWAPLLKNRKEISIMLWVGDGSEILDYNRNLDKEFEWAYYIGTANLPLSTSSDDPALSLHEKKQLYMDNPPKMTYAILRSIVSILKEEGAKAFPEANIRVGETFDIGPEFAISEFKYKRHREICSGTSLDDLRFVDSTALLNADNYSYAAYPNGIPQDTPFATFLGKQVSVFFEDMGFDYIWLSNGLGFSADPWSLTGKIFDGEKFYPEKLKATSKKVFSFWKLFREACPNIPIETRGTNNSVGIDYSTDGVPLYEIYNSGLNIMPPPNSPWAALNGNYGLEIMGHMTRICELPGNDFMFRYYIHDPWWMNSPWYDRYDGYASDIYLPMSISRVTEEGTVQSATRFNVLTIDNCRGDMPDSCVNEPLPHLLKAEKNSADEIPFLVWLYPLKEYTTTTNGEMLSEMYYGDTFMYQAINNGFPLNCVVSTDIFKKNDLNIFDGRIIVSPVIHDSEIIRKLNEFMNNGGKVLLYGSKAMLDSCVLKGTNMVKVDISENPSTLREELNAFGYSLIFKTKRDTKLPVLNMTRSNNGCFFSIFNADTTTDTLMKFPLGAPILLGGETEIENGFAKYRFNRCEHRECRVFVQQSSGIISAHEEPPVNGKYRRRFAVEGLNEATVYYFPEQYCNKAKNIAITSHPDTTPILDGEWEELYDPIYGHGFKGVNKNGKLAFLMPYKKYL